MDHNENVTGLSAGYPGAGRVIGSLALSALICSIGIGAVFTTLKLIQGGQGIEGSTIGIVLYSVIAFVFALPVALVFGGALYLFLRRFGGLSFLRLSLGGGALASMPFMILSAGALTSEDIGGILTLAGFLFLAGAIGAAIFWKLARLDKVRIAGEQS